MKQLGDIQELSNNILQAKQATKLQAIAESLTSQDQPLQMNGSVTHLPDNLQS